MDREEFAKFLTDVNTYSIFSLSLMLGQNLGLFDVLCSTEQPLSFQDIAEKAKLKDRYTKEWLSSMVAARVIHQDRESGLYSLHESLKHDFKVHLSVISGLRSWINRTDMVQSCFRQDGPYGFNYDEDPAWFDWYHDYRVTNSGQMDKEIIPLLRECGVTAKLESGCKVLDVGCGSGYFVTELAKRFPKSSFTGLDCSQKGLDIAKEYSMKENIGNATYIKGDAHDLPESWPEQFDWIIICDTLHDLHNPFAALDEINAAMKEDGMLSVFEFGFHSNPVDNAGDMKAAMLYTISTHACIPSSMKEPPHVGYGACWGKEEIEKAILGAKFEIQKRLIGQSFVGPTAFFHCTK